MPGIDQNAFLAASQGVFTLGIAFVDWTRLQRRYVHPFGRFEAELDVVPLHQYWLRERAGGEMTPLKDDALTWIAARSAKSELPSNDRTRVQLTFDYAYHPYASLYARFLRYHVNQPIDAPICGVTPARC